MCSTGRQPPPPRNVTIPFARFLKNRAALECKGNRDDFRFFFFLKEAVWKFDFGGSSKIMEVASIGKFHQPSPMLKKRKGEKRHKDRIYNAHTHNVLFPSMYFIVYNCNLFHTYIQINLSSSEISHLKIYF